MFWLGPDILVRSTTSARSLLPTNTHVQRVPSCIPGCKETVHVVQ